MPVGIRTEEIAGIGCVGATYIPTRGATQICCSTGYGAHGLYALRAENAMSVPLSAILQGGAKYGNIFGAGEYACIAADAAVENACKRVVYLSAKNLSVGLFLCRSNVLR